jgi:hypothetical protein
LVQGRAGRDSAPKLGSMTNSWKAYKISEIARKAGKTRWAERRQQEEE